MTGPKTILVVDDHDAHRKVLELVLGAHRYEVVSMRDGFEALTYLQAHTPDAIILDVHMPQLSGFDVGRRARRIARLRHVPILIMTAAADEGTRSEADAIGASRVLHKPIAGTDLRRMLQEVLGQASGVSASTDALGA
jgi:CheY-like chemotaxis protein